MRKTALLTGVAGLFLMTAPAFAQDSTAPQTPAQTPPAGEAAAQPQQLTLQPGATVRGSDGAELGRLEGVRNGPTGQELTIRGSDGQLRGVSTAGIRQEGDAVVVDASSGQFQSSPAITEGEATPSPSTAPDPASPAPTEPATDPALPTQTDPADPATTPDPAVDPNAASDPMNPTTSPTPDASPDPASDANASPDQPSEDGDAGQDDGTDEPTGGDQPG